LIGSRGVPAYLLEVGYAVLGAEEGAARIDAVHEIVPLHVQRLGSREVDGARVVHQDVDPAKLLNRLGYGLLDALLHSYTCMYARPAISTHLFGADVTLDRQRLAAGFLDV